MAAIDPLTAGAVLLATAATDAVYVMFSSAVAARKRTGASSPKTRAELYAVARRRGIEGRSKMSRDELARALGEN